VKTFVALIPVPGLKDISEFYSRENIIAARTAIGDGPGSGFL